MTRYEKLRALRTYLNRHGNVDQLHTGQYVQLKPGASLEVELLQGKVLGLKADGRQLIDPAGQRRGRLMIGSAVLAFLALYALSFAWVSVRLLFGQTETEEGFA